MFLIETVRIVNFGGIRLSMEMDNASMSLDIPDQPYSPCQVTGIKQTWCPLPQWEFGYLSCVLGWEEEAR